MCDQLAQALQYEVSAKCHLEELYMNDKEVDKKETTNATAGQTSPAKKGAFIKILILGFAGLGLIAGATFGALHFLQKDSTPRDQTVLADSTATKQKVTTPVSIAELQIMSKDSLGISKEDPAGLGDTAALMAEVRRNLEMLEFRPEQPTALQPQTQLSKEDSLGAVDWFSKEQTQLDARDKDLSARQKEIEKVERSVSARITRIEQAESARINNLAKMYDGMDPTAVARLAANLSDATVVALLPRMKQKNASQVLSLLPPQRAASLSQQMITIAEE